MKKLALFAFTLLSAWSMTAKTITGPVDYVSPLVGTQSKHALSTGNTMTLTRSEDSNKPISQVPGSMITVNLPSCR